MKFFCSHRMSWPYLAEDFDEKHDSAWIWASNQLYDPIKGQQLYQEYLDSLAYADELGFDGVCIHEHHQTAYCLTPSPNLMAAALTQRTTRCQIAVLGTALPFYDPPLRVAEEFAMLDVMSGGRLVAGAVLGSGPDYFTYAVNPTTALEKLREALDLIVKAWSENEPFPWNSKHYHFRYVNLWPTPIQKPHPPIWISDIGTQEMIEFVAARRASYVSVPCFHIDVYKELFQRFRDACGKHGYTPQTEQMGWTVPVYVAETDTQAREEFEGPVWYFVKNLLKGIRTSPPGYMSGQSATRQLKNSARFLSSQKTWSDLEDGGFLICGSPETVRQKLERYSDELGGGIVLAECQVGSLSHELTRKSMELFAREVMPQVRNTITKTRPSETESSS
ncbi:MAG: LLM class flavin-dependent oxidoreductase [Gemmataceae bacterium]